MDVGVNRPERKTSAPKRTDARDEVTSRQALEGSSDGDRVEMATEFRRVLRGAPVSMMRRRRALEPTSMAAKRGMLWRK
jgi:hypothetical protein